MSGAGASRMRGTPWLPAPFFSISLRTIAEKIPGTQGAAGIIVKAASSPVQRKGHGQKRSSTMHIYPF